jgi:hypothetical protein
MDPEQHDGGRGLNKFTPPVDLHSPPLLFGLARFENHKTLGGMAELNEGHRQSRAARLFEPIIGWLD